MKIDVLDFFLPEPWLSKDYHLAAREHPKFTLEQDGWIWYMKGQKGFPWDGDSFDGEMIFQVFTEGEKGWEDPSSYKQFTSSSWSNGRGGIAWAPRHIDTDLPVQPFLVTQDSSYATFLNGQQTNVQDLGGPTVVQVSVPFLEIVGDLGPQLCIRQTYQWGRDLSSMEVNTYARTFGWVKWQLYETQGGRYVLRQETLFDKLSPGGTPALNFPGNLP
jgi:hypothetical protein